ncbi:MAG: diaminopimelate epimerase [Gemmatimonadales bacterium]|nr:diaminopimelate epimerase [Gemmatimonadales bacterium]
MIYKMTGSGNDFVMLDGRSTQPDQWPATRVAALCDRRNGVGADGLVILTPDAPGTVRMTYWNADGSRAAMCGNAALCSARLSLYLEMASGGDLCLLTEAGVVRAHCEPGGERAEVNFPDVELPAELPGLPVGAGERWLEFALVGVPHLVVRVNDIERIDIGRGRILRHDPRLGDAGANVNFIAPPADRAGPWLIRTYERGVEAETLACGTGTVASAISLAARSEASLPICFRTRGGPELTVRAELREGRAINVWLGGQGRLVFRGVWEGP